MARIEAVEVHVCKLPGTMCSMTVVELLSEGIRGVGYTYEPRAGGVVSKLLTPVLRWAAADAIDKMHGAMLAAVRASDEAASVNAAAVSAADIAMWDLKARLAGKPLARMIGAARETVTVCACAGLGSFRADSLAREVCDYAVRGHRRISIAVEPLHWMDQLRAAQDAAGPGVELLLDGGNSFSAAQAYDLTTRIGEGSGVTSFLEPTSAAQQLALRFLRETSPIAIGAGREVHDPSVHARTLADACVDVLLVDATRCLGITGFLRIDALCATHGIPLATYGAPAIHIQPAMTSSRVLHVAAPPEHAKIETLLFDGLGQLRGGEATLDPAGHGLGIDLRQAEAVCMAA